jgi:uncharacterized membrane protein YeiB
MFYTIQQNMNSAAGLEKPPRIAALDVLRGLAILGMFYINIPIMAHIPFMASPIDFGPLGPDGSDQPTEQTLNLLLKGTERGMLSFLFGASMMLLTARTMKPDGLVKQADYYFRRNLWLLFFGLVHILILLWPFDILHVYAIAALFLFAFRKIGPKAALILGLAFGIAVLMSNYIDPGHYIIPRSMAIGFGDGHEASESANTYGISAGRPGVAGDYQTYEEWSIKLWLLDTDGTRLWRSVAEAFATMLIGVALFKWGILQGTRSRRFYLAMTIGAYAVGLPLRWIITHDLSEGLASFDASEIARIAITIGHVGLVNLFLQSKVGEFILRPFKAAGRTAFSLYLMQTIIGMFILFPPWGFGFWGEFGSTGLVVIASVVIIVQIIFANLWLRTFTFGPFEWVWRSLIVWQMQPFRRRFIGSKVG